MRAAGAPCMQLQPLRKPSDQGGGDSEREGKKELLVASCQPSTQNMLQVCAEAHLTWLAYVCLLETKPYLTDGLELWPTKQTAWHQ